MCSHQSEKASKGTRFLSPRSSKITVTKEKARKGERERARTRKGGEEKKAIVALLVIIMTTFGRKKNLLDLKDPFGDNVFSYPARYISHL